MALIVIAIIGFMCVIITGKWLLDNREKPVEKIVVEKQVEKQIEKSQPECNPVPKGAKPQSYPYHCPQYHHKNDFWKGYSDGCSGRPRRMDCPEYLEGYRIGMYDRGCKNHYYYDHYCPKDGFSLTLPNFSLNIR